jgi:protein-S-isoprenylcysteine O-methyltransferase Ste14
MMPRGHGDANDTAAVIAPPPLIYLAGLVVGLILGAAVPTPFFARGAASVVGAVLIAAALWLALWGVRTMRRAGTSVRPDVPTTALVTTGPFDFSRNPLYVSLALLYGGIAVAARSLWALLLLIVVLAVVDRGVIGREERYLERKFGVDYREYKTRVRRWL